MNPRVRDEPDERAPDEDAYEEGTAEDGLDATYEPEQEGDDDDEIEPLTHLGDEDYERFVANELPGAKGGDGHPPVAAILIGLTLLIVLVVMLLA